MTKIVYRIQKENGIGPYHCYVSCSSWQDEFHTADNGRPGPYEDEGFSAYSLDEALGANSENHYFGFKSLEDLMRWFNETERQKLAKHGYKIYLVEARQVWYGKRQVIFKPSDGLKGLVYEIE
jgi:hypothetical protein